MGVYTEAVQKLYVAYFNRPADAAGLSYWEGVVGQANGSTAAVSAAFAASAEYKDAYAGKDAYGIVAQVYQNLFGHQPDLPGLNFWGQAILNGQVTVNDAVTQIAKGAQGTDLTAYNNKVAAATLFTGALDTSAEVLGYSGTAANSAAKSWLSTIGSDATAFAAATTTDAINSTVNNVVTQNPLGGQTFALTAGLDNIAGTSGNDTINAYNFNASTGAATTTLSTFDVIDGGAGVDTLNLDLTNGNNTVTGTIRNVEIINVTGNAAAGSVDASVFQGATNVNLLGGGATVTGLAANTTAGFNNTTGNISVTAAGASAAVALTKIAETATLNVSGSTLSSVTVSGARVDSDKSGDLAFQTLNVTTGKNVQTLTLNTNQATLVNASEATGSTKLITTLDASASTGAISISGDADLATIKTGSGNDSVTIAALTAAATGTTTAVNAMASTGAGNDNITVNVGATSTGMTSVDAGAGNDIIVVNKDAASTGTVSIAGGEGNDVVTINGTLSTKDVIDGGAGSDTIKMAAATERTADDYIVFNKLVTNFETIGFTGAETGLDASKLAANYTGIDLASGSAIIGVGTQSITAHGDVDLTAAGYKVTAATATAPASTTYAGTIGVSDDATGAVVVKAEAVNLAVKATTVGTDATLTGDFHTATVTLTNSVSGTGATAVDTAATVAIDTATSAALKSLTLTGTGSATVTNGADAALTTVDASGLNGTLTLGDDAGNATAGLTYTSTNTAAETIKLGAAIDNVTIGSSLYGAMDTVTGLTLVANTAGDALASNSDHITVTGVTDAVKFTTTQTDIDLALKDAAASTKGAELVFQLGGDTYVFHNVADANGATNTIDANDTIVKLTGTVDLDTLILALNGTAPA
jgi:hypothetical protein